MSTPADIRVNIGAPFPVLVKAAAPVTMAKKNGIWTVGLSVASLGAIPQTFDPTAIQILAWNATLQTWQQGTLQRLIAGGLNQRLVTAAGNIAVLPSDLVLLVKQTVPAAVNVTLPVAASRNGIPITVKDLAGAAAANPLTLVPNGLETIDGGSSFILNNNFEAVTLNPITASGGPAGWWIG